jgi:hypothetical protein
MTNGTIGDPNTSRTWSPMPDLSLPTSLPPGGGVMAPRPYDPVPLEQQLEGATDPSILPSLPPGIESGNRDPHLYSMSWGKNVDIDPETGRPSTSTLVRDPISHTLIQAHEATGGGTVSNPGGQGDEAYEHYLANTGHLAEYKQQQQDLLDISRNKIGDEAAPPTTGELLQAQMAQRAKQAPLDRLNSQLSADLQHAQNQQKDLQTQLDRGLITKEQFKSGMSDAEDYKANAQERFKAGLLEYHSGAVGNALSAIR